MLNLQRNRQKLKMFRVFPPFKKINVLNPHVNAFADIVGVYKCIKKVWEKEMCIYLSSGLKLGHGN